MQTTPSISQEYLNKIKSAFLDSLYAYLDGLVHLAFSDYSPLEPVGENASEPINPTRIDATDMVSFVI
jgi:exocyst complex component 2